MEQKNGAVVRRLVGYGSLRGRSVTSALATQHKSSRRHVNFFQPLFELKSKTRDCERVHEVYFTPATPCEGLLVTDGPQQRRGGHSGEAGGAIWTSRPSAASAENRHGTANLEQHRGPGDGAPTGGQRIL